MSNMVWNRQVFEPEEKQVKRNEEVGEKYHIYVIFTVIFDDSLSSLLYLLPASMDQREDSPNPCWIKMRSCDSQLP